MDQLIYHYTDLNSLLGIIGSDSKNLTFWGSRYDCMNDPLDYQFAKNRLLPKMMDVAYEISKEQNFPKYALKEIDTIPYIVSFSKKKDDFLRWRMYNAKVALVLDKCYFSEAMPNRALIECEYVDQGLSNIRESFFRIDEQISNCINISANTSRISTFIKEKSFETEGEVRLATWDYYDNDGNKLILSDCKEDGKSVCSEVKSRVNANGKMVLFKKFYIDKNSLAGIIVHSYSQVEFKNIQNILRSFLISKSFSREVFENITLTNAYPFNL